MSDEQQHTPGPWSLRPLLEGGIPNLSNQGQHYVMAAEGRVALVDSRTGFGRGQGHAVVCHERDANAHLIAAAPELLEALKQLKSRIEELSAVKREGVTGAAYDVMTASIGDDLTAEFIEAEEAIAKAEGR